jgi:hypothetical protein
MKAKSQYSVEKWDEKTYEEVAPQMKLTRSSVDFAFKGDLMGRASVEYLMFYTHTDPADPHKATATYSGMMHFKGSLAGNDGSFAMLDEGRFENGAAISQLKIIAGSGQGALKTIAGQGSYHADKGGFFLEIDYSL